MERFQRLYQRFHSTLKKVILIGTGGIMFLSLSGCYLLPEEETILPPPLVKPVEAVYDEVIEAKIDSITYDVKGWANFASVSNTDLSFTFRGGHLKAIYAKLGDKVKKGDVLVELDNESLESQIKEQEIMLKKSQIAYEQLKASKADKYALEQAALDMDLLKLKVEDMKTEFVKSRLISPVSGIVCYVEPIKVGEYVDINRTVVRIADPNQMELRYEGELAGYFKPDMKVKVKYNDKEYDGVVVNAPPAAQNSNSGTYIPFKVSNLPAGVSIGDYAYVTAVLQKKDNVITLPDYVIHDFNGRKYVKVLENGLSKERDVQVGLTAGGKVEITSGIKVGDKIIVR